MGTRLGCTTDISVFITGKCGKPTVCRLQDMSNISWNRKLDDISDATVTIPLAIGAGGKRPCCGCTGDLEPWCHELHIFRNGAEVWTGPITNITYGFTETRIDAKDVLVWTLFRVPELTLDYTINTDGTPVVAGNGLTEVTDIALDILKLAYADEDPCVFDFIFQTDVEYGKRPTPFVIGPKFTKFSGSSFDHLTELASLGLDFTTLGRRIILSAAGTIDRKPIGLLTDQHILGEVAVSKNGLLMGNRAFVRYRGDDTAEQCAANAAAGLTPFQGFPCPALGQADEFCYGPLEILRDDTTEFGIKTANITAAAYADAGKYAPRTLEFPFGTRLSPDAPFGINDLVPGYRMTVGLQNLCFDVFQDFRIQEVDYSYDVSGEEQIGLTLSNFDLVTGLS